MFGYALLLDFRDNLTRCSGFPFIPLFTISETITKAPLLRIRRSYAIVICRIKWI